MATDDSLTTADAATLARLVRAGEVSARAVLEAHLTRIDEVNPAVNAIVTLDADRARREAAAVDAKVARGEDPGPLAGVPIAVKDTHATAGMRTTFGSPVLRDNVPDETVLAVQRILDAGAVLMGKTNCPEFAAGSHTFNDLFGTTRNPYDLSKSAGGSSGGAAAALASGMQPIADGSDMGGSLRNPASFCNVVGFRPTPGRVPSVPSMNAWANLSTPGPMARTVEDVALLFSVMAGPDPRCPISLETPGAAFRPPWGGAAQDLSGLRIAWAPDLGGAVEVEHEVLDVLRPAVRQLGELGAEVVEACPDFSGADETFRTLRAIDFDVSCGALLDRNRDRFKPSLVWNIDQGRMLTEPDVVRATILRSQLQARISAFFGDYDLLVAPVAQVLPFDAEREYPRTINGLPQDTYLDWMRVAYYISVCSVPAISVPAGFSGSGLPVGLQIIGPVREDLRVLRAARAFEAATWHARRHPQFGEDIAAAAR